MGPYTEETVNFTLNVLRVQGGKVELGDGEVQARGWIGVVAPERKSQWNAKSNPEIELF